MKIFARLKKSGFVLITGVGITFLFCLIYIYQPTFFVFLDGKLYDSILSQVHSTETTDSIIIVDIDEKSLEKYGQWPWPRYRIALLCEKIRKAGVAVIGTDILFSEADRSSPKTIQTELKRDLGVDISFLNMPEALLDNDQVLTDYFKNNAIVLGYFFNFETIESDSTSNQQLLHELNLASIQTPGAPSPHHFLLNATGVIPPLENFAKATDSSGFINTVADDDGVLRSTPLIISYKGKIYPSLSLASLLSALPNSQIAMKTTSGGIESINISGNVIPLDKNGRLLLHYRGERGSFPYISASDFFTDKYPQNSLNGKIALIGSSAAGLKDIRTSPLDPLYPGIEAHATTIDNILKGDFFSRPDWSPGFEFAIVLLSGLIWTLLIAGTNAKWTLPLTFLACAGLWHGSLWFMQSYGYYVSPLFPFLSFFGNFTVLTFIKFRRSEREKSLMRNAFSKYVSTSIIEQIENSPKSLSLSGEEKEVSVLFSDIRGFTTLSEKITPTQVIELLNDYFTPMTRAITNNLGTLDKFIGDAIMAFWNAPISVTNHQAKAVQAAIQMLAELGDLNAIFKKKYGFEINIGIGLHAGNVRVGNMGTNELFDYTIIGDVVNTTSRLEGMTNYYGVRIILSEAFNGQVPNDFTLQDLDYITVKGRKEPLKIYGLYSGRFAKQPELEMRLYNDALSNYRERQFQDAHNIFTELHNKHLDRKLYALYLGRCRHFIEHPPDNDWDGVFRHSTK